MFYLLASSSTLNKHLNKSLFFQVFLHILADTLGSVGVIVSALVFAWKHAKVMHAVCSTNEQGSKVYSLRGPLFFGSSKSFQELFDPNGDPDDVIVDFERARVSDHSAIEAIDNLAERYLKLGKMLHLRHLSPDCKQLLHWAGSLVEINVPVQ